MHGGERMFGGRDGLLHVVFGVSCTQECRFELRWRQVDSIFQHRPEETSKGFGVALGGGSPVSNRPRCEEPRKHRADAIVAHGYASIFRCGSNSGDHFAGEFVELGSKRPCALANSVSVA